MTRTRLTAALLALALGGCAREELLHGLDERQASEVLVALAHRILAERELPRAKAPGVAEVFGKGSMVPTPTEEHALLLHALAGELARSVEAVDGVVAARVHLGLRQPDPLRPTERGAPRASLLVKCRASACAAVRALEPGLRALVAGAVEGLEPAAVALVVSEAAEAPSPPPAPARRTGLLFGLALQAALAAMALALPAARARLRPGAAR